MYIYASSTMNLCLLHKCVCMIYTSMIYFIYVYICIYICIYASSSRDLCLLHKCVCVCVFICCIDYGSVSAAQGVYKAASQGFWIYDSHVRVMYAKPKDVKAAFSEKSLF